MQLSQMLPTQICNPRKIHNTHHMELHMAKMVTDHMINMGQTQHKIDKWATNKPFIQRNIQESGHWSLFVTLPRLDFEEEFLMTTESTISTAVTTASISSTRTNPATTSNLTTKTTIITAETQSLITSGTCLTTLFNLKEQQWSRIVFLNINYDNLIWSNLSIYFYRAFSHNWTKRPLYRFKNDLRMDHFEVWQKSAFRGKNFQNTKVDKKDCFQRIV